MFIKEPKIFTVANLSTTLAEIFQGIQRHEIQRQEHAELFQSFTESDFLEDWLVNSVNEGFDSIIAQFKGTVQDEKTDQIIQQYFKLIGDLNTHTDNPFLVAIVHENARTDYVRSRLIAHTEIANIQNHIDFDGIAEDDFSEATEIELNFPEIGFAGTWYII